MVISARGKHRRQEILQAAGSLFSLRGYFHTSTTDILEAVAISKGAFYYHFRSKEELVAALLEELRKDYEQEVIKYVDGWADVGERLTVLLDRLVELNTSGRWYNCLLLTRLAMESCQYGHDLSEQIKSVVNWLTKEYGKILAEAQAAGGVREDVSTNELAEFIISSMFGAIICRELGNDMVKLDRIAEMLKKFMRPVL
jgi:TetR/AcrR family transcriptional regulator, transcriptional repressor for nem operon